MEQEDGAKMTLLTRVHMSRNPHRPHIHLAIHPTNKLAPQNKALLLAKWFLRDLAGFSATLILAVGLEVPVQNRAWLAAIHSEEVEVSTL
jgi:hypothetical protein